ncbi:MAG: 3-oxoacyl-ACP synthase [Bacteroidales bacterium]|mgnify:FL=1|nr:3-oxoacyl-ACP synthase [Bacteroidales bacterium]
MVYCFADNVMSPLGVTTAENYQALREGCSALTSYASYSGRSEDDYVASRFTEQQRQQLMISGLTWFESLVYHSVNRALKDCCIDISSHRILFIVSTTKANIDHISSADYNSLQPAESAKRIASLLGLTIQPLVVCNACISGVAALVTAQRMLENGCYDTAIVVGCDVISHFVVSGFQSLKALSPEPCRPFDIERLGLNLGEAAATMILSVNKPETVSWQIVRGAIRNDGYHITSPSPKGEGCASVIKHVTEGIASDTLSAVNVHGTATMYNDQMESKAIESSGLSDIPINTLKGYYGHTLGASGILETIITMHSVSHGELLATLGFSEIGVSGKVNISSKPVSVSKRSFVKIISGFGGCNAAVYINASNDSEDFRVGKICDYSVTHSVNITPHSVIVDEKQIETDIAAGNILAEVYKRHIGSYPKFYKMDRLSQLGFVASELLLNQEHPRLQHCADRAVVLFNHTSSLWVDREYARSIVLGDDYFPSPSLFVYTLPNIVCGEIAVRNGYHAETSFYILPFKNEDMMHRVLTSTFLDHSIQSILAGWIDYVDESHFEAELKLIVKK